MAPVSPVILIVEDEFLLRMDSAEMIETAGFEVVQAGNADRICFSVGVPCSRVKSLIRDLWPWPRGLPI
jgi:hypothetical protein